MRRVQGPKVCCYANGEPPAPGATLTASSLSVYDGVILPLSLADGCF